MIRRKSEASVKSLYFTETSEENFYIIKEYEEFKQEFKNVLPIFREIILWRRPFATLFLISVSNITFYFVYIWNLDTMATVTALLIIYFTGLLVASILPARIKKLLVPPLNDTREPKLNQRLTKFVECSCRDIYQTTLRFIGWNIRFLKNPTTTDLILFLSVSIPLFIIFFIIETFWPMFVLVNLSFVFPVLLFNQFVCNLIEQYTIRRGNTFVSRGDSVPSKAKDE